MSKYGYLQKCLSILKAVNTFGQFSQFKQFSQFSGQLNFVYIINILTSIYMVAWVESKQIVWTASHSLF